MATLKQRLHRKNSSGTYDTIHLETGADCITGTLAIAHGGTGATTAANARTNLGAAASSHNHSAANITSGTLSVARGGTGVTSISALKSALDIGEYNRFKLVSTKTVTAEANGAFDNIVVNLNTEYAIRILIVSICNIYGYATRSNQFRVYDEIKVSDYFTGSYWTSFMCDIAIVSSTSTQLRQEFNCTGIGIIDNYTRPRYVYYADGTLSNTSSKNIVLTTKFKAYADNEWSSNGPRLTLYKTSTITQKIYAEIIDV